MQQGTLDWLQSPANAGLVRDGLRGLEQETLRVDAGGALARTPHPHALGSALTHRYLTTDYSEALLEFVTPPFSTSAETLEFLSDLHSFCRRHLGDELLWPASMPCILNSDAAVPIADYGTSNEGRLRSVYRSGLGLRYGRTMQAIAGVHFNYSLPESFWDACIERGPAAGDSRSVRSDGYMDLIRNYRRCAWLVAYLFGASPAFCKSFRPNGHERLEMLNDSTWFARFGTSLRMSDMGYRNTTQARLNISANSLTEYLAGLREALTTTNPDYAALGVRVNGDYRQLNANVLQIENEYYSQIRPKPASRTERTYKALVNDGVAYVEVRTLDLNPYVPVGVDAEQMAFLEVLLLTCLMTESPPISADEQSEIDRRELAVAWEGRRPSLAIEWQGRERPLRDVANMLLDRVDPIVELLDRGDRTYREAVEKARAAADDPELTLSARLIADLERSQSSFFDFSFELAVRHRAWFLDRELASATVKALEHEATRSLAEQDQLERARRGSFAAYLEGYFSA